MYSAIAKNRRNTFLIVACFIAFFVAVSLYISYLLDNVWVGVGIICFVLVYTSVQYFLAGRIAMSLAGGKEISKDDHPRLWNVVENIAISQGMPMPRVFIMEDESLNAFATGRDPEHALVGVTKGMLANSEKFELEGVMAHEMGHVKNYDILVTTIVFALVGAFAALAQFCLHFLAGVLTSGSSKDNSRNGFVFFLLLTVGVVLFVVGIASSIVAFLVGPFVTAGVSRQREYLADATGAHITRHPEGLMSALNKIEYHGALVAQKNRAIASMYFEYPFKRGFLSRWLSSHPPTNKRIARLAEMAMGRTF